jgi:DNA-binding transcriptional ArsR family regulator
MARAHASAANLEESAPVFAALGDRTRLRIVSRLSESTGLSTAKLTSGTRVSRQAVAKHLNTLAEAGLVRSRRSGRERLWELQAARLARAGRELESISKQWDAALERLRRMVE